MMELEDNQLDFNQPLLTVRRFSSTVVPSETRDNRKIDRTTANLPPLPRYKSDLKSGPVRNPGTVPFIWEQSPGRPKAEEKSLNPTLNASFAPPKPPPGKNPKQPDSNKVNQVVEADREKNSVQEDGSSVTCERVDDAVEKKADSGSEIDDEAFLDALETFSLSESQCFSCSVSGLSGVDDCLDSRLSGRFSKEAPAREFMMGRFLPAAKAMASEAPVNVIRKPQLEKDQPRHKNAINEGKRTQLYQHKFNTRFGSDRYRLGDVSEDDFDEYENTSAKMCGLLPQFCLSNAVSIVGVHTARSTYPLRRFQVKSSYKRRQGETWCWHDGGLVNLGKSAGNFSNVEQHADKSEPKAISNYPISERDGKILEATSLYKIMQSREVAKHPDSSSQTKRVWADNSVKDIVVVENSVTDEPCKPQERHCMNFRQLLESEGSEWESGSKVPIFEKTVYVDAVQMVESLDLDVSPTDSRGVNESVTDESDEKKNNVMSKSADDDASVRSSLAEITSLDITQKSATSSAGTAFSAESSPPLPASEGVVSEITVDVVNGSKHEESSSKLPEAETTSIDNGKNSPEISSVVDGKIDLEGDVNLKLGDPLFIPGIYADFPIPPPLPKSPSDSWLLRTLPSMLSKNSGQCPSFAENVFSKVHPPPKPSPIDPKWETIVKTSNVDRGHLRFSKELLAPIPESCAVEH